MRSHALVQATKEALKEALTRLACALTALVQVAKQLEALPQPNSDAAEQRFSLCAGYTADMR